MVGWSEKTEALQTGTQNLNRVVDPAGAKKSNIGGMKTAHQAAIEGLGHLAHGSGRRLSFGGGQEFLGNLATPANEGHDDMANDSVGQVVGPFANGLVGDAERLGGGGDGAAEQFNGVGFAHAPLNHSSFICATLVHGRALSLTMVDYKTRLARAMEAANVHPQVLADHLGVSLQSVRKVLAGGSAAFNVTNHFEACQFLRIDPEWLATGVESDRSGPRAELPSEADNLAGALEVLTSSLLKVDEDSRDSVGHLLESMAKEPQKAQSKARLILRLLVTEDDSTTTVHHGSPTSRISGKVGNVLLGDKDGRRDRAAASGGSKK